MVGWPSLAKGGRLIIVWSVPHHRPEGSNPSPTAGFTREVYNPSDIVETVPITIIGNPDKRSISTSYIERQNLTMRMQMRRLTRLTNGFSKKLDNLKAALALHFAWYNFGRIHQTLKVTPAMEAGITDRLWGWEDIFDWSK